MRKKLLQIALLLLSTTSTLCAQDLYEGQGVLYIKVSNILRETQQIELAEKYLKDGYLLIKGKDKYWEAAAEENMGLIALAKGDQEKAEHHFHAAGEAFYQIGNQWASGAAMDLGEGEEPNNAFYPTKEISTPKNMREASDYIRTSYSLCKAGQFSTAEKMIQQAITYVKDRNPYWESSAYEHMGMIYYFQDKNTQAAQAFEKALIGYTKSGNLISAKSVEFLLKIVKSTEEIFGVVEITTHGIQADVFGVTFKRNGNFQTDIKYTKNDFSVLLPTDGKKISVEAIQSAAKVSSSFINELSSKFELDAEHIFVIGSSGIGSNANEMKFQIQAALNDENKKVIFFTPTQEAELIQKGCLPTSLRYKSGLIACTPSHILGAFIGKDMEKEKLYNFQTPYGVDAFVKKVTASKGDFSSSATSYANGTVNPAIKKVIKERPVFGNRDEFYLAGDIVWAMIALLHPEKAEEEVVEIKGSDVLTFKALAQGNYNKLIKPSLDKISDSALKTKVQKDIQLLTTEMFTQNDLIAGSLIIDGILQTFANEKEPKKFFFVHSGHVGLPLGFVLDFMSKRLDSLSEGK